MFKMKYLKLLFVLGLITAFVLGFGSFANNTKAANQTAGVLAISYPGDTLFSASNIAPGYSEVKTITVKNNGLVPHSFSIAATGATGPLAEVLHIEPRVLGFPVWNKTLANIAKSPDSNVVIGSIAPGGTATVDLAAILPSGVANDYQSASTTTFSFVMGNESTDQPEPNPTHTVLTSASNTSAGVSVQQAAGNQEVTADTVNNNTVVSPETASTGQTAGVETSAKAPCYWWWMLLAIYAVFLMIYGIINYRANGLVFGWVWPIFAGAVFYLVHWILHDYYTPVKMCGYFIWFEIGELAIYYLIIRLLLSAKKNQNV
jgi:hypothetical protein